MAYAITWDQVGEKTYQTGVDHGVLYKQDATGKYPFGVAWNGLINVTENPSGAELTPLYSDNIKYLNLQSAEEYGMTIECYTYPKEWEECNGESEIANGVTVGQQPRSNFGFSYRSLIGNDVLNTRYGYKIHLIYGCTSTPSEKTHQTVNDSPDATTFSFEVSTTPVPVEGKNPTASIEIDSTVIDKEALSVLENILYGNTEDDTPPRLPSPDEIAEIFKSTES